MALPFTLSSLRRIASVAILIAIMGMLVVLSCHGTSLQFAQSAVVDAPSQSCEEHQLHAGGISMEKSIFDMVSLPNSEIFFAIVTIIAIVAAFPRRDERRRRIVQTIFFQNKRKRWIWARHLPFSSVGFLPYFVARHGH